MSKDRSAKYHQENIGRLQKRLTKDIKPFQKRKRTKATIWVWTINIKISLNMKNKG